MQICTSNNLNEDMNIVDSERMRPCQLQRWVGYFLQGLYGRWIMPNSLPGTQNHFILSLVCNPMYCPVNKDLNGSLLQR